MIVRETRKARRFEPLSGEFLGEFSAKGPIDGDVEELLRAVARLPEEERLAIRFFFLMSVASTRRPRSSTDQDRAPMRFLQSAKAKLARWLRECGVDR